MLALIIAPYSLPAQVMATKGVMDLRHWNFDKLGPLKLSGEWEIFMSEFVAPQAIHRNSQPLEYIDFPSTWNDLSKSLHPGFGFATYHVKVILPQAGDMALELPHLYSNYKLWINSELIAANGEVGATEKTSLPQWLPQTVSFNAAHETLDIVIQVSNFHHAKGGIREPIVIGKSDQLVRKREIAVNSNLVLFTSLFVTALIFVLIFVFFKRDHATLYFSLLCIAWAIRSIFSNLYVWTSFFPNSPWELVVKVEYITLYATMISAILLLSSLFPNDVNKFFKYFLCICNAIFIALTLFFKASLYTQFLPVYLSFCLVLLVYIIYVLIRAVVYEREGVWLIVSCLILGVVIFSYDLIAYQGIAAFNSIIINVGYLVMFLLLATSLAYQLGFIKRPVRKGSILTYEDLFGTEGK
ncbi:MAG: 7TM-DISM domain-containing protein [Bacteroidota bacterium]